jgi:hypothetical protein
VDIGQKLDICDQCLFVSQGAVTISDIGHFITCVHKPLGRCPEIEYHNREMVEKRKREELELPGADLGLGDAWKLGRAIDTREARFPNKEQVEKELDVLRMRCHSMLSQAQFSDVEFFFEDSEETLHGHRAMLCAVSQSFRCMFRSTMKETKTKRVQVPPGISSSSFKGFLEFVYMGRAGVKCTSADGRELWILAEMYNIPSLRKWLLSQAVHEGSICAAYEFALVPEGVERGGMIVHCESWVMKHGLGDLANVLRRVGLHVIKGLIRARLKGGCNGAMAPGKLQWRYLQDIYSFVERWVSFDAARIAGWSLNSAA